MNIRYEFKDLKVGGFSDYNAEENVELQLKRIRSAIQMWKKRNGQINRTYNVMYFEESNRVRIYRKR